MATHGGIPPSRPPCGAGRCRAHPTRSVKRVLKVPSDEQPTAKQPSAPSPGGAAARRAKRPTLVAGTIRPDPGSRWSPRRPPIGRLAVPDPRCRRRGGTSLTPAACRAGWSFPPGEGIGRTRPGAGSRPRRGRFRPLGRRRRAISVLNAELAFLGRSAAISRPLSLPTSVPPGSLDPSSSRPHGPGAHSRASQNQLRLRRHSHISPKAYQTCRSSFQTPPGR
jgi:hypothetical protein